MHINPLHVFILSSHITVNCILHSNMGNNTDILFSELLIELHILTVQCILNLIGNILEIVFENG